MERILANATHMPVARTSQPIPTLYMMPTKDAGSSYLCDDNLRLLQTRGCPLLLAAVLLSHNKNVHIVRDILHLRQKGWMLARLQTV
jgi:hypothetical protein